MVYDVAVYFSSLPRISDHNRKVQVMQSFADGTLSLGLTTVIQREKHIVPAKLAVMIGWVGTSIKGPHIQLRKNLIQHQQQHGHKLLAIDGSCFKFVDHSSRWLRYSLDGVYYNSSNYANINSSDQHWQQIQNDLGLELRPWRTSGDHVLVCLQRDGGWSMKGTDMVQWAVDTVKKIRLHTDRPILIRSHPKHPVDSNKFKDITKIKFSQNTTIQQDLNQAWASVFFNSSACVASLLAGVPIFAADDDCVAWSVANHDLHNIENPKMFERQQWLYDLSAAHWTDDHGGRGDIYKQFREFL